MSMHLSRGGLLTTVQDGGRQGLQHLGVGLAGAMDTVALQLANLLVGNDADAAALEITLHGPQLHFDQPTLLALTGAPVDAKIGGDSVPLWRPVILRAGAQLTLGGMHSGARSYLAIAGGMQNAQVLASRSSDLNAALGLPALQAGMTLDCYGERRDRYPGLWHDLQAGRATHVSTTWSLNPAPWFESHAVLSVNTLRGAHFDHLDGESQQALFAQEFEVSAEANRVGYRLHGPTLRLKAPLELISEGVSSGTLQLPPSGQAIVLMAEHPSTGGYPRIAHIIAADHAKLAQARSGQRLRFVEVDMCEAQRQLVAQQREIEGVRLAIGDHLGK